MPAEMRTCPDAPPEVMPERRPGPPNRYVVLDRAWAERLGVHRQGGTYRIRRSELVERLAELQRGHRARGWGDGVPPLMTSVR
jgi:hypothetical protein